MSPPVATVQVPVRGLRVKGRCPESVPKGAEFLNDHRNSWRTPGISMGFL